ncbi:hypothetical protein LNQ52_16660 [Klebsiella pneumoniae subsp. pneumoniae]|nr:hypothetical protein [Klebsiella pneumoniae subsp. pneumoniae]
MWSCSIHDPEAAIEYAQPVLKPLPQRSAIASTGDARLFGRKPRTTVGWKGLD